MADNYLENKMEEHRRGITPKYHARLTPTGRRPGSVTYNLGVRRVFVTAGASAIGRAIVREFANAGCRVAFCDSDLKGGMTTAQATGSRFTPCDVADSDGLSAVIASLIDEWGDIDIIVNSADFRCFKSLADTSVHDLRQAIDINLTPLLVTARALALHRMGQTERNPYGRIINIGSARALQGEADTAAYAASKGAVVAMTHSLMASLEPLNVTVNCISPGREGRPDDIARMCLTLALPDNAFINGQNIIIDGGVSREMDS